MSAKTKAVTFFFLITIFGLLVACSQTPEPTASPNAESEPTSEPEAEPTGEPAPEPEVMVVCCEVIIDNLIIQILDEAAGDVQVVVQGHTTHACNAVEQVSASKDGDVFLIKVGSSLAQDVDCEEGTFPFEETVSLDVQGLSPGTYTVVAEGVVERFEFGTETTGEGAESPGEEADADTEEEPAEAEPREACDDFALFLADVTYPDNTEVQAGEVFTKTWEVQNSGTCTWGVGYEMVFVSGPFTEAVPLADPFPDVAPLETVELSVAVTAPTTAGVHKGAWVIQRPEGDNVDTLDNNVFDLWAIVIVSSQSAASAGGDEITEIKDGVVCAQSNSNYENEILQLINAAREDAGLVPYAAQPQLTTAARALTNDMACNDFVSQTGSDGSDWYGRITEAGYAYSDAAEIIFSGIAGLPEIAYNWWTENLELDGTILDQNFTQIGIAYALNPQTGRSYYSVVFAVP
jgi:uncharacterized protein YkwD